MSRPMKRNEHIAKAAEREATEAAGTMSEDERLEAEAKGRRSATDVKTSGEKLKDTYRG